MHTLGKFLAVLVCGLVIAGSDAAYADRKKPTKKEQEQACERKLEECRKNADIIGDNATSENNGADVDLYKDMLGVCIDTYNRCKGAIKRTPAVGQGDAGIPPDGGPVDPGPSTSRTPTGKPATGGVSPN